MCAYDVDANFLYMDISNNKLCVKPYTLTASWGPRWVSGGSVEARQFVVEMWQTRGVSYYRFQQLLIFGFGEGGLEHKGRLLLLQEN